MSILNKQCQFIQLPKYPRCQKDWEMCLQVKRPGDRWRFEKYCRQHGGFRKHQYGQLKIPCKEIKQSIGVKGHDGT